MNMITIVSISTGDASMLTAGALDALQTARKIILRTAQHPITQWLSANSLSYDSLDSLYDAAETFDAFNQSAAQFLGNAAKDSDITYAVPDPAMDSTVSALMERCGDRGAVRILPGISHADRCIAIAHADMQDIRVASAEGFLSSEGINPRISFFLSELHSKACAGLCKIKLMRLLDDQTELRFFSGDENGQLIMHTIPLYALDRQKKYDHTTACLYTAKPMTTRTRFGIDDLCAVMNRLRAKGGCPWDREQTHESLLPNLLEESYEFIEAAREQDDRHMCEELGDVLLQVVFHAVIAEQFDEFTLDDVATGITAKLIERHPHVFGKVQADTAEQVLENWEQIKRKQRGIDNVADAMENVSTGLSALLRAYKVQRKAAKVGFDFSDPTAALTKVIEEHDEILACLSGNGNTEEELGDLLFSVVNVCRLCNVDPDIALYAAVNKFICRFRGMENSVTSEGKSIEDLTLSEMDVYWMKEKRIQ